MTTPLPSRLPRASHSSYTKICLFSELLKLSDQELHHNILRYIYIDNLEFLKANFDYLQKLIKTRLFHQIVSNDIECLKYIEENLNDYTPIVLSLTDDYENKDRHNIHSLEFTKTTFELPLSYILWFNEISAKQKISLYMLDYQGYMQPVCSNGYDYIDLESLKKIRELINTLALKFKDYPDVEKAILISNYLQSKVQYVDDNNINETSSVIYKTDFKGLPVTNEIISSPETVLLQHYGLCNGIANATMLLLNNPEMNVNIRSIKGCSHAWNVILIDGKYYFIDNTWNITRNQNRYPGSLKAKSFCSDYLFFGSEKASTISHHIPETFCPIVEPQDLMEESIKSKQKKLSMVTSFTNYPGPVFESHRI